MPSSTLSSLAQRVKDETSQFHANKAKTHKAMSEMYHSIAQKAQNEGNHVKYDHYSTLGAQHESKAEYHHDASIHGSTALDFKRKGHYGGSDIWGSSSASTGNPVSHPLKALACPPGYRMSTIFDASGRTIEKCIKTSTPRARKQAMLRKYGF